MAVVAAVAFGLLGAAGAVVATLLYNLSTLLALGNAGCLLRFEGPLGQPRPTVEGREEEGTS